jgi:hypothetical protein
MSSSTFQKPPILDAPMLNVPGLDKEKPIVLESVDMKAFISGFVTKTTLVMVFRNPHNRLLEGNRNLFSFFLGVYKVKNLVFLTNCFSR